MTADTLDLVDVGCDEAVAAILGTALYGSAEAIEAVQRLQITDVTNTRQRLILAAMHKLVIDGTPVDPVTVLGHLRARGANVGMPAGKDAAVYIADLMDHSYAGSPAHHLRVVLEHALRRVTREAGTKIAQAAGTSRVNDLRDIVLDESDKVAKAAERLRSVT